MVQAIARGIEIIRLLEVQPMGVSELSKATTLPKATVHRLLKTFSAYHWVDFHEETRKYHLSWGVLPMAKSYLSSLDVRDIARPHMIQIRDTLQQSVNLFLHQGDYRVCIERMAAERPLRSDIRIGSVYPIFKGAAGAVFEAYVKEDWESNEESKRIRQLGYVLTRGRRVPDAASIAVPLFSFGGKLEAVMTISGPIGEYTDERSEKFIRLLLHHGHIISSEMGASI